MAVTFALIGVGGIGAYHLASLRTLEQRGLVRLAAVADPTVARFPELKRELEARGVRWYLDYRDMLHDEPDLAAVTIATPIPAHFEMALACLERGVFVNLEKPPVPLVQQLETLIQADVRQRVTVGFQMILSPCIQRMKQLLVEGFIGELQTIRACGCWPRLDRYYQRTNWAGRLTLDGEPVFDGPATNALAHLIHNIMLLAGPAAAEFAVPVEVRGELYRARPIESYDVACLGGRFASGAEFSVAVSHATKEPLPVKLEARGDKGWLRLSEDGAHLETSAGESLRATETTQRLIDLCYHQLVDLARGVDKQLRTTLKNTSGYVRATNGLLLSSDGIHDISSDWVEQYEADGDGGFHVRELRGAIERVFDEGLLFSEQGLEWAVARPLRVQLDSLHALDLYAFLERRSFG